MGFKLVRVDAEEPNKIQLPIGTHLIGRGTFLDCEDKRISRNHGNLIVSEDSVTIEALHQNPCFFTRKGSKDPQVLKKSCAETLDNGDRFGLLPGSYWYEVLQCTAEADSEATDVTTSQEQKIEVGETNDYGNDKNDHNNDELNETIQTTQLASNDNANDGFEDNEKVLDFDLNETVDTVRGESPSLLDQENQEEQASNQPSNEPAPAPGTSNQSNEPETTDPMEPKSPSPKRSHSPDDNEGVKKIKTEPVDAKQELLVKQESDDPTAGPSNDQAGVSNNANDAGKAPPSPAKPPNRERCMYGADCYRRNPQHKAQFSHPADADWGSGARAPCPYGAACRKRDPRHYSLHDHPPGARPPPPQPRAKRQRHSESSDNGTDLQTLILSGKRKRKPLPRDVGSDSEPEDPFQSDGSDEWEPPSQYTESLDF